MPSQVNVLTRQCRNKTIPQQDNALTQQCLTHERINLFCDDIPTLHVRVEEVHIYISIYIHVYICIFIHIYIYTYVYVHIYIGTHIYIYIYINRTIFKMQEGQTFCSKKYTYERVDFSSDGTLAHTHTHTHAHTHTHIHTHTPMSALSTFLMTSRGSMLGSGR